ncbi:acyl-CoA dehydrogenase [Amycolatopsis alkalitolerans]|uniref:acyl-CoA dehydrogenase n=1 Tax=Amycolatopsis alkalitolerans TaxID=2547244 RepID=UPI003898ED29
MCSTCARQPPTIGGRASSSSTRRIWGRVRITSATRCGDATAAELLGKLRDLCALSAVEEDRAWFLEHGRITASHTKAVIAAVNDRCRQLRPRVREWWTPSRSRRRSCGPRCWRTD